LPFTLDYYSSFCDKIIIYDNESTDSSDTIFKRYEKVSVVKWKSNKINELNYLQIKNNAYKNSREDKVDYVIVCDMDELLYHPDLIGFINNQPFTDYFTPRGYHMVSDEIPTDYTKQIYEIIQNGLYDHNYCKNILFKRENVIETNYEPGAHQSNFKGTKGLINCNVEDLKLLHYKWLSPEYIVDKHIHYNERRSQHSKKRGWGSHYSLSRETMIQDFNNLKNKCTKII
jgi:hypothetical protein